jgi:sensitive to high expression protein 9
MLTATQTLNDLTGYSAIESIKAANAQLESDLASAQARLRAARQNYKSLTNHRASTQREVTTLLARKDTWSPADLERFTTLYRSDHELEAKVARASAELTEAESEEGRLSATLNAGILRRYHEEQIWSDRIRRASTWGTWGLMGVNVLLFIGLQFVAEPWKRRRLVKGFAEAESGVWEEVRKEVGEVRGLLLEVRERKGLAASEAEAVPATVSIVGDETVKELEGEVVVEAAPTEIARVEEAKPGREGWNQVLMDAGRWQAALADLYSERRIDLSMRDASTLALEGAATGAAVAAGLVFIILGRS